ncbi:MAG: HD-GYP domain-containing protein [Gemmatimonadaceae bacterium]|nr:HD-GYP domain-containing protein [Gemmatimonadaceae bacterium]
MAVLATAALASLGATKSEPAAPSLAVLALVVLSFVAQLLASRMPKGGTASVAFVPLSAATMLSPTLPTVVMVTVALALVFAINKSQPIRVFFNGVQAALGLSVAALLYLRAGGDPSAFMEGSTFEAALRSNALPGLVMLSTLLLINSLVVSSVIALSSDQHPLVVWKGNTLLTLMHLGIALPTSFIVAYIAGTAGALWVSTLVLPLMGMRQLYQQAYDLQQVNQDLLELMIKAIEARDPYTSGHSRRVSDVSRRIAVALQLSDKDVENVRLSGLLHDVGKIHEVFAPILQKPGKLSDQEWEVMKTHPALGADLVSTVSHLRHLVPAVRGHHENWDGSGYPDGLAGELVPLGARIIAVADTIDALTSDRSYRSKLGPAEVRAELVRCRGKQFDPHICDVVLSSILWNELFPPSGERSETSILNLRRRAKSSQLVAR